jgi:hypothetical protein
MNSGRHYRGAGFLSEGFSLLKESIMKNTRQHRNWTRAFFFMLALPASPYHNTRSRVSVALINDFVIRK